MRAVRLAVVALIGMALAILPISASFAAPPVAHTEMCTGAHHDSCGGCDTTDARSARTCNLKCCSAVAILAEPLAQTGRRSQARVHVVAAALSPFLAQPDPPPPRS